MSNNIKNILSIDVEDFFQINAFSNVIRYEDWGSFDSRVEKNTIKILDLLDSVRVDNDPEYSIQNPVSHNRATFFVLGWIAARFPNLVKEIHRRGHEVACHGYAHQLIFKQDRITFKADVKKAKEILENITGVSVLGYRAPTYTITKRTIWALEVLYELGFKYDSSIFPVRHDVYGWPESPRYPYLFILNEKGCDLQPCRHSGQRAGINGDFSLPDKNSKSIIEFPISTFRILNKNIPVAGGGYFRLFPYILTRYFLQCINDKEKESFIFYLHPWEIDPDIPKIDKACILSKFRTYVNLDKTLGRLQRLIRDFNFTCFADIIKPQNNNFRKVQSA